MPRWSSAEVETTGGAARENRLVVVPPLIRTAGRKHRPIMITVLALLLLGGGLAVILNTLMNPAGSSEEFPRFGGPARRNPGMVPVVVGVLIALGGMALVLASRVETP